MREQELLPAQRRCYQEDCGIYKSRRSTDGEMFRCRIDEASCQRARVGLFIGYSTLKRIYGRVRRSIERDMLGEVDNTPERGRIQMDELCLRTELELEEGVFDKSGLLGC